MKVRDLRRTASGLAQPALDAAWRPAGRRRFADAYAEAVQRGPVRIAIGAGKRPLAGWLNTDVVRHGGAYLDATVPWPVRPGSVELVYGDNVIEHVTLAQARELFRHAFTAMQPGGIIRLATPDVEAVARQYLERGELAQAGMARNAEKGRHFRYPVELLRQVYVGAQHYLGFIYDYEALAGEMTDAGFAVRRVAAGQSEHPALRDLEVRRHPAEEATELIVEGVRPA